MDTGRINYMKTTYYKLVIIIFFVLISIPEIVIGMTAEELKGLINQHEELTIIDIRNRYAYAECHICGAINIPAGIIDKKHLPPIGRVIVCGDGIDTGKTVEAVNALNAKVGIDAEKLDGGIAAWEALNYLNTRRGGFTKRKTNYISYQQFKDVVQKNPDLVIIDIREKSENIGVSALQGSNTSGDSTVSGLNLTNIIDKFPGVQTLKLKRKLKTGKLRSNLKPGGKDKEISLEGVMGNGKNAHHKKLYVLIDNGNGDAEEVAYRLKAAGIKRVSVLVGGELTLRVDGKAGKGKK